MLKQFQNLIGDILSGSLSGGDTGTLKGDEVRIACAALLVHCAKADGVQSAQEDAKLREVLSVHYEMSDSDTQALIDQASAREAEAADVHNFTRVLHKALDRDGRLEVVRLLWEISLADATIDHDERTVVHLVASLLDVETADVVALRQSVSRQ